MKKTLPIIIALILIIGGGAFYGGMKYQQSKAMVGLGQRFQEMGTAGIGLRGGNSGNAGFVSGEIIAKDENSITVKLQDGGSKIIFYSGSTTIQKTTSGSAADLTVGKTVSVSGKTNDDGSITAQSIQLRPALTPSP